MMGMDDKASELEESFRELAMREQSSRAAKSRMRPKGACYFCGDVDTPDGSMFCCVECRDDYDAMIKAKRIAGKR